MEDATAGPSPCDVISSETLFAALTSLSTTTTCAPSAARRLQIAAPMPLPPPGHAAQALAGTDGWLGSRRAQAVAMACGG